MVAIPKRSKQSLKLGNVEVSVEEEELIERYRSEYRKQHGDDIPLGELVMSLALFGISKDRAFQQSRKGVKPAKKADVAAPSVQSEAAA